MHFGYKKLYIDGSLKDAEDGSRQKVICPANGSEVAEIAEAGKRRYKSSKKCSKGI